MLLSLSTIFLHYPAYSSTENTPVVLLYFSSNIIFPFSATIFASNPCMSPVSSPLILHFFLLIFFPESTKHLCLFRSQFYLYNCRPISLSTVIFQGNFWDFSYIILSRRLLGSLHFFLTDKIYLRLRELPFQLNNHCLPHTKNEQARVK